MNDDITRFDFLSSRLNFIEVSNDHFMNIELWHHLSAFENHVYGVFLQYNRIKEDLNFSDIESFRSVPIPQAGLDIYFYSLTWDKLKKIYDKIKVLINRFQQTSSSIPEPFTKDFRLWKRRIDHLFSEFDNEIRNEYEHPSLESYSVGNIIMWGNIIIDGTGNIKAHVGRDWFATIKKEHIKRIQKLRTDLFDLFIKHFSDKPLTQELIEARKYIEDNIDSLSKELDELKENKNWKDFNELLHKLTMCDLTFTKENMPLPEEVKRKIYSIIFPRD
jgi:hypothetical protein